MTGRTAVCECGHPERVHVYNRKTRTRPCIHKDGEYSTGTWCQCKGYRPVAS